MRKMACITSNGFFFWCTSCENSWLIVWDLLIAADYDWNCCFDCWSAWKKTFITWRCIWDGNPFPSSFNVIACIRCLYAYYMYEPTGWYHCIWLLNVFCYYFQRLYKVSILQVLSLSFLGAYYTFLGDAPALAVVGLLLYVGCYQVRPVIMIWSSKWYM